LRFANPPYEIVYRSPNSPLCSRSPAQSSATIPARKGKVLPRTDDRLPQSCDMFDEQGLSPFQQINREEPAAARNERRP